MTESLDTPQSDGFERFDEAQPFLQLLADMLNRLAREQAEQRRQSVDDAEEDAG